MITPEQAKLINAIATLASILQRKYDRSEDAMIMIRPTGEHELVDAHGGIVLAPATPEEIVMYLTKSPKS